MYAIIYSPKALQELAEFRKTDENLYRKIKTLIANIAETPFSGLGKPEALKHNWRGFWSRRITKEHRLVYKKEGNIIYIVQCRFHYN